MNFKPTFRVHLAAPLGLVDTPFIITTAYTTATGLQRAEWFLVIPEGKGTLYAQHNELDLKAFPDDRAILGEELLLNEALDQAILRLRHYIQKNNEKLATQLLAAPTEVRLSDHHHLVKLWLRGSCCGCLSEIRAKSECPALIETLVWIHGLPMLTTADL